MKIFLAILFVCFVCTGFETTLPQENIEFVCIKTHKASNTCYFNFMVDNVPYAYADKGCKKTKDKEETIKKVKEGKLSLAKDWKIDCGGTKKTN